MKVYKMNRIGLCINILLIIFISFAIFTYKDNSLHIGDEVKKKVYFSKLFNEYVIIVYSGNYQKSFSLKKDEATPKKIDSINKVADDYFKELNKLKW